MGLDNGFILHSKENPGVSIYMATFRNFYELDGWITSNCSRVDEDISSYLVSEEHLRNLLSEIEPIAKVFSGMDDSRIAYYEDNFYTDDIEMQFYDRPFCPVGSGTSFVVFKILRLWHTLKTILEMLDEDYDDDLYLTFYSSF